MSPLLQTHDLTCGYGKLAVVRGLSISVSAGEVVCLLGANGAGKTTTLLTIAGALPKIGGRLTVLGQDIADRGYVMAHGAVVAEGTAAELQRDAELLEASYLGDRASLREAAEIGLT
jgi:branched-chain amino acid transport system ATP-binding protein